jgi:NADPH-dependent 2,4-dienoyl-CoA reductase/sulfur reductase-like enzyme
MKNYDYLIVGGGMTADAAAHALREVDSVGAIGMVGAEADPPYDRPPLTKGLWKDKPFESIWRDAGKIGVDMHLGRRIEGIDLRHRQLTDDQGSVYSFKKLLLATGAQPRQLPFGGNEINYYRTAADYRRLRKLTETGNRFAVIGGGFIGSEIAAALAMNHKEVLLIFPGEGICSRMFPADLSRHLNEFYRQKGVEVLAAESVTGLERQGDRFNLTTKSGRVLSVDGVIAGVGVEPNVQLARLASLRVEDGIVVDEFLRTSHPDVYAAGDVAAFYNAALHRRMRVEHEDNANAMGRQVGLNMAGKPERYLHQPFFYSDMFELGYEAVGDVNARVATVADWKEPFREGVVYYQQDGKIRGVLLWNVFGQVDAARKLIAEGQQFRPEELLKEHLLKAA